MYMNTILQTMHPKLNPICDYTCVLMRSLVEKEGKCHTVKCEECSSTSQEKRHPVMIKELHFL